MFYWVSLHYRTQYIFQLPPGVPFLCGKYASKVLRVLQLDDMKIFYSEEKEYTPISLTDKARIADTVMDYAEMYVGQSMTGQGRTM